VVATVATLALATAADVAVGSVLYGRLFATPPFAAADRLVTIEAEIGGEEGKLSAREVRALRQDGQIFSGVAVFYLSQHNMTGDGLPESVVTIVGTITLFQVLGVGPVVGDIWPPSQLHHQRAGFRRLCHCRGRSVLELPSGTYDFGRTMHVTSSTGGARLTDTINGVDPTIDDAALPPDGSLTVGNYVLKVRAWKSGASARAVVSAAYATFTAPALPTLSMSNEFTAVVGPDLTLSTFGGNFCGQLWDGTTASRTSPILVSGALQCRRPVRGGHPQSRRDGLGYNNLGQAGDNSTTLRRLPVSVVGRSKCSRRAAPSRDTGALGPWLDGGRSAPKP
jgi:hypothetical protein